MAAPPLCFSLGAWDSLFGFYFFRVSLFTSSFHTMRRDEMMFSLCQYLGSGTSIHIFRRPPVTTGCPGGISGGGQGPAGQEAGLSAFCIAHLHWVRLRREGGQGGVRGAGFASDYAVLTRRVSDNSIATYVSLAAFQRTELLLNPYTDYIRFDDQAQLFSFCNICHQSFCHPSQPL